MSTRIGLVSDPHAAPGPLAEALAIFAREGCEAILCAGDIGGYNDGLEEVVALLQGAGALAVRGNHEQWALGRDPFPGSAASRDYFESLPRSLALAFEGVSLYMVHAEPPEGLLKGVRLLDQEGALMADARAEWTERLRGFGHRVLVVGHTHQAFAEQLADTLVINPGSSCYNHSCAILTVPELTVEWFGLSGRAVAPVWHWGDQLRGDG